MYPPVQGQAVAQGKTVGKASSHAIVDEPWYSRISSVPFKDFQPQPVINSKKRRICTRSLVLILVIATVVSLTVVKYLTDKSLTAATTTKFYTSIKSVPNSTIEESSCPCSQKLVAWSSFAILNATSDDISSICQAVSNKRFGTDEYASMEPSIALSAVCRGVFDRVQLALRQWSSNGFLPDYYGGGVASERAPADSLRTQPQLLRDLELWLADILTSTTDAVRQQLFIQTLMVNNTRTKIIGNSLISSQLQKELQEYMEVTSNEAKSEYDQVIQPVMLRTIWQNLKDRVAWNYTKYEAQCKASFCVVIERKQVQTRVTEFVGLVGGLWTSALGVGLMLWWVLQHIFPL